MIATMKNLRELLCKGIMLSLAMLFAVLQIPLASMDLLHETLKAKIKNKVLKYVISAPLTILFLVTAIPTIVLGSLIDTLLATTSIILFPEFFFSLWIKEGIKFSRVLSLSTNNFFNFDGIYSDKITNVQTFIHIKDNNRKFLVTLLQDNNLSIKEVISFHEKYSELLESVTTKILDQEKSKIIFDYLDLSNSEPLIQKNRYVTSNLHEIYSTCWRLSGVVNNIDTGLLKTLLKLDVSSLIREPRYARASRLSNIIVLFDDYVNDNYLVKSVSDSFKNKKMLAVQVIKDFFPYLESPYDRDARKNNLRRFLAKKDLIDNLSSDFNHQSSLIGVVEYFLLKEMRGEEFDKFVSMLEDKNVIKNLKLIDNINNVLPGTLECNSYGIFLGLGRITNPTVYGLRSLLANNRLFNKLKNIPPEILKDICSTELYTKCKSFDEALALFDCLDDKSTNKNVLDKLIVAFEKDSKVTHALLSSPLFNSQDEILQMLSDERFDATKIKEMLNRINLWWTLQENSMLFDIKAHIKSKLYCVFHPWYIGIAFDACIDNYVLPNEIDQLTKRAFFENVNLFKFFLKEVTWTEYELILPIIQDTKFEHLVDGSFTVNLRNNIHLYSAQLLNFDILEFLLNKIQDSGISDTLLNKIQSLHAAPMKLWENILETKFIEFFAKDKYQGIKQESLAKIQDLTIADLLAISRIRSAKIENHLKDKGITNSNDLSLLAELINNGICFADTVRYKLNLKESMRQTICDLFDNKITMQFNSYCISYKSPAPLLDLCKINIIRSSLTEQVSC